MLSATPWFIGNAMLHFISLFFIFTSCSMNSLSFFFLFLYSPPRAGFASRKGNLSYTLSASPLSSVFLSNFATSCPCLPSVPTLLMMIIGHWSDLLTWDDYRWLMMAFIDMLLHFMIRPLKGPVYHFRIVFSCFLLFLVFAVFQFSFAHDLRASCLVLR